MVDSAVATGNRLVILRWIVRAMLVLWAGFWLFFNIASIFYWLGEEGPKGIVVHVLMTVIIVILALAAWFLELVGGILLIVLAGLTFYKWGLHQSVVALTLSLPPFIIGVLLIICWARTRLSARLPLAGNRHTSADSKGKGATGE